MSIKNVVKLLTPPLFMRLVRGSRTVERRSLVEWEYVPEGWDYVKTHTEVKGWNVVDVLAVYKEKWPKFVAMVDGVGPLGVSHESELTGREDILSHNNVMAFAFSLALSARLKERVSMLDWGGGIGHFALLAQKLLPDIELSYYCKDITLLADYGSQLFPNQHFCSDESCFNRKYDFVMANAALHYTRDWQPLLQRLADATSDYLYIANLPMVQRACSFVFVQRPYEYGYNTEYLAWCLNRTEFLDTAERSGLRLVREFVYGHQPHIHGAPEQNNYCGFLYRRCVKN